MCAGGVLSYLVLIPAIKFFGDNVTGPLAPGTIPISQMGPDDIREAYILYIGAGAVAAGGIISLFRSIPTIWHVHKRIHPREPAILKSPEAPECTIDPAIITALFRQHAGQLAHNERFGHGPYQRNQRQNEQT